MKTERVNHQNTEVKMSRKDKKQVDRDIKKIKRHM